jgi:S-adenosylmethionine decarboxylase
MEYLAEKMNDDIKKDPKADEGGFALGRQMTVEFYDCDHRVLDNPDLMEEIFVEAAKSAGATVITSNFHKFTPQGVSGVVIISESHFAVHAWPEYDYAAVDLFTCGEGVDFNRATAELEKGLRSGSWIISSLVSRGIVGNGGLERLVPALESRDARVFQLSWQSRYEKSGANAISAAFDLYECAALNESDAASAAESCCGALVAEFDLMSAGSCECTAIDDECVRFSYPLENGMLSGFIYPERRTVYVDLFVRGFFDPRRAAECAMATLGGEYYRLQPHVRQ